MVLPSDHRRSLTFFLIKRTNDMSKKHILIVDDEAALRQVLEDRLLDEGFIVTKAVNGKEGLSLALEKRPDLILLDIMMPIMDGLTMLEDLRRDNEYGNSVPVILLTNINDHDKVERARAAGSHDCLMKSDWDLSDVLKKIRAILTV